MNKHPCDSLDDFILHYRQTGKLWIGFSWKVPNKPLNEKQLHTAYRSHLRKLDRMLDKQNRQEEQQESEDQKIRFACERRDGGSCRLLRVLTAKERSVFDANANCLRFLLDTAHVFGKNAYPHMRYMLENVVMLNRLSHNWLDAGKSPIDGGMITAEDKAVWWERILGGSEYRKLKKLSMRQS